MKNFYIKRNESKEITGLYARPQYEGHEKLSEKSQEIVTFLKNQKDVADEAQLNEQKIQTKMRQMAIESLQADNELPSDFKD